MESFWRRRSIRIFLAIGFGLPWLGWTIIAVTDMAPSPLRTALFYMGDFMTVAGLVATVVAGGGPALKAMLRRCLILGGPIWFSVALLLPLLWQLGARIAYLLLHDGIGSFEPAGLAQFVAPGALLAFTTGPLGEEAGWRGFFLPRLLTRYGPLTASVLLGLIWGVWHFPLYVKSVFATASTASAFVVSTVCFSILMTILFHRTRGSLLLAVLFHWSVNVSAGVAGAMLPASRAIPDDAIRTPELMALVLTTVVAAVAFGWDRLGRRDSFQVERDLAAESVGSG